MLVQFGNNWIQKIPLTAKLDSACGLVQFWLFSEFFSSNYFQIGQHIVLLHIQTIRLTSKAFRSLTTKTHFYLNNLHDLFLLILWLFTKLYICCVLFKRTCSDIQKTTPLNTILTGPDLEF